MNLEFGYSRGVPTYADTAWGARWIIKADGHVDMVFDRQDIVGTHRERLSRYLNIHGLIPMAADRLAGMIRKRTVRLMSDAEVVLYQDDVVCIAGSPQASGGYFYVAAWLKD